MGDIAEAARQALAEARPHHPDDTAAATTAAVDQLAEQQGLPRPAAIAMIAKAMKEPD